MKPERDFIDGEPATPQALARLAASGFGHFTTMPLRAGAVPGLELHLARLDQASRTLFGCGLAPERVREHLRRALHGLSDAWLRISVSAANWTARDMPQPARLQVFIQVRAAAEPRQAPVRLQSVLHQRYLPDIKHSGLFDLLDLRRRAQLAGFDDVLLKDGAGRISEGSTWNLGALRDDTLFWPEAPRLQGTTMQLLAQGWKNLGGQIVTRVIDSATLARMQLVFCCNAGGVWPVASLDEAPLAMDAQLLERLRSCLATAPASVP
ncbi:MAG: aminotransferase class IV [Lysobacteraceae bacterium]